MYMIHASPARMWYVEEFLIPSMETQGISRKEIVIWNDTDGKGNLVSCMKSFGACGALSGGFWHLQDDVIISSDFAEKTRQHDQGIVCGFGCENFGPSMQYRGTVPALFMWYSFQCIRIPNEIAGECAGWFFEEAQYYPKYRQWVADKKHDDIFFREFLQERHPDLMVENLAPNLVDHIDWLIGGTLINRLRAKQINRSAFWAEEELITQLEEKLKSR